MNASASFSGRDDRTVAITVSIWWRRIAAARSAGSLAVASTSCRRIDPSRYVPEATISPARSRLSRALPPPTSAISASEPARSSASPTPSSTAPTISRLSSAGSMTSTSRPVVMNSRSRKASALPASRTALVATARTSATRYPSRTFR